METLRHHLDSPEGLIVRYQYLGLPMTATEQATLINRYGNQIQGAISNRFDKVDDTLNRIEYLTECHFPLREVEIKIQLNAHVAKKEISNATCIMIAESQYEKYDTFVCILRSNDSYPGDNLTIESFLWQSSEPTKFLACGRNLFGSSTSTFSGACSFRIHRGLTPLSFGDFVMEKMSMYCTPSLRNFVKHILLVVNGFVVFELSAPEEDIYQRPHKLHWPEQTSKDLSEIKWIPLTRTPSSINISQRTLYRLS